MFIVEFLFNFAKKRKKKNRVKSVQDFIRTKVIYITRKCSITDLPGLYVSHLSVDTDELHTDEQISPCAATSVLKQMRSTKLDLFLYIKH